MNLSEVAVALNAEFIGNDVSFTHVSTDTRTLQPGELFVALSGPNFDARRFLSVAKNKGAIAAVVEKESVAPVADELNLDNELNMLRVFDTRKAFGRLAVINRQRFQHCTVGITGSSGKTTVKKMVATILQEAGEVLATKGNLNNDIGVPITLLSIADEHRYAVVEMGASAPGDISYLAQLVAPDIALVTNAGNAHLEGFGSIDAIAKEKGSLYSALSASGVAVVNLDDVNAPSWISQVEGKRSFTFSLSSTDADVFASDLGVSSAKGNSFNLHYQDGFVEITLAMLGRHNVLNGLAAATVSLAAGVTLSQVQVGLSKVGSEKGRLHTLSAVNGALLIDDSYNANSDSVKAAVNVLSEFTKSETILVLGDLAELGKTESFLHQELGVYARNNGVDALFSCGPLSKFASDGFGANARHFANKQDLILALSERLHGNCVVLVKGSRSAAMDVVVDALVECEDA